MSNDLDITDILLGFGVMLVAMMGLAFLAAVASAPFYSHGYLNDQKTKIQAELHESAQELAREFCNLVVERTPETINGRADWKFRLTGSDEATIPHGVAYQPILKMSQGIIRCGFRDPITSTNYDWCHNVLEPKTGCPDQQALSTTG